MSKPSPDQQKHLVNPQMCELKCCSFKAPNFKPLNIMQQQIINIPCLYSLAASDSHNTKRYDRSHMMRGTAKKRRRMTVSSPVGPAQTSLQEVDRDLSGVLVHVLLDCEPRHLNMHEVHLQKTRNLFFLCIHPLFSKCRLPGIQNHKCLLKCALTLYQALCLALYTLATPWVTFLIFSASCLILAPAGGGGGCRLPSVSCTRTLMVPYLRPHAHFSLPVPRCLGDTHSAPIKMRTGSVGQLAPVGQFLVGHLLSCFYFP